MSFSLTEAERCIVARAVQGEPASFARRPVVRAAFLRRLLLGLELGVPGRIEKLTPAGLRISGIVIDADLDLEHCRDLPALRLHDCDFRGDLLLHNSRIAELSLKGSRINGVRMWGAQLGATFDFSGVTPLHEDGQAWINAHGCSFRGNVVGDGARLRSPRHRHGSAVRPERRWFALRLSDCKIDNSLFLRGDFRTEQDPSGRTHVVVTGNFSAEGGVNLDSAQIRGDLVMTDAVLTGVESNAVNARAMKLGGTALLNRVRAVGEIFMSGVRIAASLNLDGASLAARPGKSMVLRLAGAEIGGNLQLKAGPAEKFRANGRIWIHGAIIRGNLECSGAWLHRVDNAHQQETLDLRNTVIECNAALSGVVSIGWMSLANCRIGGDLEIRDTTLAGLHCAMDQAARRQQSALNARNLKVGGDLTFTDTDVLGAVRLDAARIEGQLRWDGLRFRQEITLNQLESIFFGTAQYGLADLAPWGQEWLEAERDGKTPTEWAKLSLPYAVIGTVLRAKSLTAKSRMVINLRSAHVGLLEDEVYDDDYSRPEDPDGWGQPAGARTKPRLKLDGFRYDRIHVAEHSAAANGGRIKKLEKLRRRLDGRDDVALRRRWLMRQYPEPAGAKREERRPFYPQPHIHLASVLRSQGYKSAARGILYEMEKHEAKKMPRSPLSWTIRLTFGWPFGYGLNARRATATAFLILLIGWIGVHLAQHQGVLVLTPDMVQAYDVEASYGQDAPPKAAPPAITAVSWSDDTPMPDLPPAQWPCDGEEIEPFFYALDMMLPVIPLHQEDRCEIAVPRTAWDGLWWWHVAAACFSIIGKIVISLALITYSGVLRPKDE